ncbi:hypothetical protein ACCS55_09130 [Rhizobium ruizarguesonis]
MTLQTGAVIKDYFARKTTRNWRLEVEFEPPFSLMNSLIVLKFVPYVLGKEASAALAGLGWFASNLRLLTRDTTWLVWKDRDADAGDPSGRRIAGARSRVEDALGNLVALLAQVLRFCAKNGTASSAPGMSDVWNAIREIVSDDDLLGHGT